MSQPESDPNEQANISGADFAIMCDELKTLRAELTAKKKALSSAKIALDAKDRSYSVIEQRFSAMAAKAATTDSERECNERLTAEIDALTAELTEARRQLKEASEQEPEEWRCISPGGTTTRRLQRPAMEVHKAQGWTCIPLYAAPVPQPAVPDDVARDAAVGAAIQRAARDLPEWCAIEVRVERGSATVYAYDKECDEVPIETSGDESLADEIDAALAAILSATDSEVKK